jgi:hypothetical protein
LSEQTHILSDTQHLEHAYIVCMIQFHTF